MEFLIYVIAISFQVSGALLLMIYGLSTKREAVVKRSIGGKISAKDGDTRIIDYDKNRFKEEFRTAYLSKAAFFYIAIGYLLGIWGSIIEQQRLCATVAIALFVLLLITGTGKIIDNIFMKKPKVNKEITEKELDDLGIEVDIESISTKEIEDIINGKYR